MAGIYLHIPFCSQACHYCDFHFSVSMRNRTELVEAMKRELLLERDYLGHSTVETIYFGGGTPSVLNKGELGGLIDSIAKHYSLASTLEICLEANPEQLDQGYLKDLLDLGVQRLSIGVQSFDEQLLTWMNRSHTVDQAEHAVKAAAELGFRSINIDLIYGIPGMDAKKWEHSLQQARSLPIDHLSSYALTLEERTPYAHFVGRGTHAPPDEEGAVGQFELLRSYFDRAPWEQYEISNFALDGSYSRHNVGYWKGTPYLGVGPSAHSFDGSTRRWNRSSNAVYIVQMMGEHVERDQEVLTPQDIYNEYVLTGLRTKWGVELPRLMEGHPKPDEVQQQLQLYKQRGWLGMEGDRVVLTHAGMLYADGIASSLFLDHSSHRFS